MPGGSVSAEIKIDSVFPPIPVRHFDYCAYREGEDFADRDHDKAHGVAIGWGRTSSEAVADLLEQEGMG